MRRKPGLARLWAAIKPALGPVIALFVSAWWAPLADAATVTVTPTTLPDAQVGTAYSQTLMASPVGGDPYTWSITAGSLPTGLGLSSAGNQQASLTGTPTAAGPSTFTVQVTDSLGDTAAAVTYTLTVDKGAPAIIWTSPAAITYGTALSSTQLNASSPLAGTFTYSPPSGAILNAGTGQSLSVLFTPTDSADYTTATATVSINVNPAVTTLTVTNVTASFAQSTVTLKAVAASSTTVNSGTITFTVVDSNNQQVGTALTSAALTKNKGTVSFPLAGVAVGGYFVQASYDNSINFNPSTNTGSLTVNQATPSIVWDQPAPMQYGTALGSAQLSAASTMAGTFVYSPPAGTVLNVGSQELSVTFTPQDATDYATTTASVRLDVVDAKTKLLLTSDSASTSTSSAKSSSARWIVTYGDSQATLGAQVSAAIPVTDGTVTFAVTKGSALVAILVTDVTNGSATADLPLVTLHPGAFDVAAVYDGSSFFSKSTASGALLMKRATPVISWSDPADIPYGTPLGSTQLNATASSNGSTVSGTWVYGPPAGTVLQPGSARVLRTVFRPSDTVDFTNATRTVTINVLRAPTSVYVVPATALHTAKSATLTARLSTTGSGTVNAGSVTFTVSNNGLTVGSVSASVAPGVATASLPLKGLSAGSYTISATYSGSPKFLGDTGPGTLTLT